MNQHRVWLSRILWMLVGIQAWTLLWDLAARMAAIWGLAWLDMFPAASGAASSGWLPSLRLAALLAGLELALLAACTVWTARWARGHQATVASLVQRALARTSSAAIVAFALLLAGLAVKITMLAGSIALSRAMPLPQQYGGMARARRPRECALQA